MKSLFKFLPIFALLVFGTSSLSHAQMLLNHNAKGVVVQVKQTANAIDINVSGPKYTRSKIFKLKSPARIVIDLNGSFPKIKESFYLNGDPEFREIRMATHPDKLRIVLELAAAEAPNFTYADGGTSFFLRTNRNVRAESQRAVRQNIQPEPRLPNSNNSLPEGPAALSSIGVANVSKNNPNAARAMLKPEPKFVDEAQAPLSRENLTDRPAMQGAGLMDINFIQANSPDDLGAVRLTLTERDSFTLLRTDVKEYKLILSNTRETGVRPDLPYYPPQGIQGITVITPVIENGKVVLNIGTDKGFRMRAVGSGRDIIVRAVVSE